MTYVYDEKFEFSTLFLECTHFFYSYTVQKEIFPFTDVKFVNALGICFDSDFS